MNTMVLKSLALCLSFLSSIISVTSAQTSIQEIIETPQKTGGVYYAYPVIAKIHTTPPPNNYKPFYISHLGRHGSRYLISDTDYTSVLSVLNTAQLNNALTPLGLDVLKRLDEVWIEAEGHGGDLAPLGIRQQRKIAERMYHAHPEVFSDSANIYARSTTVIRCVLSMDAFCERLKELNPNLKTTREASTKYMSYLNFHTKEAVAFRSSKDTWRKDYQAFEDKHIHPNRLMNSLFRDKDYLLKNVEPKSLMLGLFEIASGMQNIETNLSFYDLFEKEELFDLWQNRNYRLYVEYANAKQNRGIMMANAKPLLKNILDSADEVISLKGKGATLRFAHDGNLIPLAMLLHLNDCYTSVSEPSDFYKVWSDFNIAPMAGNVQLIFFRKDNSDDVLVKFLLNEQETLVPPIKTTIAPYYHWKDVESYYKSLLAEN